MAHQPKLCELCGKSYLPKSASAKFCLPCRQEGRRRLSRKHKLRHLAKLRAVTAAKQADPEYHRYKTMACTDCGKEIIPRSGSQKYCDACAVKRRYEQSQRVARIARNDPEKWAKYLRKQRERRQAVYRDPASLEALNARRRAYDKYKRMTDEEWRLEANAKQRKRLKTDTARKQAREYKSERVKRLKRDDPAKYAREQDRALQKKRTVEYKERENAHRRLRYATDEGFRAKCIKWAEDARQRSIERKKFLAALGMMNSVQRVENKKGVNCAPDGD